LNWDVKVAMPYFRVTPLDIPQGTQEKMKYFHLGSHLLCQELKPVSPEYEEQIPTTNPP
jgi:hypothetical protein